MCGDVRCHWATWFRAHYDHDKAKRDPTWLQNWGSDHTRLVDSRANELEEDGYTIYLEGQNRFSLTGSTGVTIAGCPDIVAVRDGAALVIDCKTGKSKTADEYQVLTYMLCLPHVAKPYSRLPLSGLLQYNYHSLEIASTRVDERLRSHFREVMQIAGGTEPPAKRPSGSECRFWDITALDCPERDDSYNAPPVRTDALF